MGLDANSGVTPGVVTGTYTGSTAAQTVTVGFRPSALLFYNNTDKDTVLLWHNSDVAAAVAITTAAASTTVAITVTDHGFVLPASNSVVNEDAKVYVFLAFR